MVWFLCRIPVLCALVAMTAVALAQTPGPAASGAQPPKGASLLPDDARAFRPYNTGPETARVEVVPVEGRSFKEALRLTTLKKPVNYYDYGVTATIDAPIRKGDTLWISFWTRRIESRAESGEAVAEVALEQPVGERKVRPLERGLSFGPNWTQTSLPFVVENAAEAGQAKIGVRFGYAPQVFEIGGITLINCGPNVALADLPRTITRYEGYAPNAPWRKAAAARIEKIRKGDLVVTVTDQRGKPLTNAAVQVRMTRHAFGWGTEVDPAWLMEEPDDPDHIRYRETVEKYFNKVVYGNALKWGRWIGKNSDRENVARSLPWLKERHIAVRGHVMVWPSWEHLPAFMSGIKNDPPALRKAVEEHIADQTKVMGSHVTEWDVINETYRHHDLMDVLGRDVMADWFRLAHAGAPNVQLFYNDYTLFQGEGPGSPSQYFYDTVQFLKDKNAPIGGIGEQGHFGGSPLGPPGVIAALDRFSRLGLPIQITEFDIDAPDEGLQADYMRDFMTAAFSHPSVTGVVQWGFWEGAHWKPSAALWDKNWKLRPHGQVWVDLVTKTWRTDADGRTGKNGAFKTRGFYGDYEVTVTRGGTSKTVNFALSPQTSALKIALP